MRNAACQHFSFFHKKRRQTKFLGFAKLKAFKDEKLNNTQIIFSSTDQRPVSYCHGVVTIVRPSIRVCVRKLFLQKTSP